MRIRDVFSNNLQQLCSKHGGPAHIARALDMSRQQLNTYLSRGSLPSEPILEKICNYFNIEQSDLVDPYFDASATARLRSRSTIVLNALENAKASDLNEGIYSLYLTVPDDPNMIVRTTILTKRSNVALEFRRITSYHDRQRKDWKYFRGKHFGVVLQAQHALYLLGFNQLSVYEPSLVVLEQAATSFSLYVGLGIVTGLHGPAYSAAVLLPQKDTLSASIKNVQALSTYDESIPRIVLDNLKIQLDKARLTAKINLPTITLA